MPRLCRGRFGRRVNIVLWLQAEVVAMATKHSVSMRVATYMLSIDRVAAVHRLRGLYA